MTKKKSSQSKINNEIIPLLAELCKHEIIPRYGKMISDGFTINHAHKLLENLNTHVSKKTVERGLNALVRAGILDKCIAGKEMAYWRSK